MDELKGLEKYREEIDELDVKIVSLIADRIAVCRKVAKYKKEFSIPMMQPNRVNSVIKKVIFMGQRVGLSEVLMSRVYKEIINEACRVEDEIIEE